MKTIIFLLFISALLFSCGNDNTATNNIEIFDNEISKGALAKKGQVLFSANCKVCHS